jgi:hypothetical protein
MEFAILFLISIVIVLLYNILNYIDMHFIQNDFKPIKIIVKESIIILLASLGGLWVYTNYESYFIDFFSVIMNKSAKHLGTIVTSGGSTTGKIDIPVFTDSPDF